MFGSVCSAFKDIFTASQYEACQTASLQKLDQGLVAYSSYFITTANDTLLQTEDQATQVEINSLKIYDMDQATEIIGIVRDEMITIFQNEFEADYSQITFVLNWILIIFSIIILLLAFVSDRVIYRRLERRYRFMSKFL